MQRRQFVGACVGAAVVSAAAAHSNEKTISATADMDTPFSLSVMLWTVYRELSFERRLAKVAEAGYHAVELVDEYKNWSKEDFVCARAKKREMGMVFDATSGITRSLCDPSQRPALLSEIQAHLGILQELECQKLIVLTGDKVPGMSSRQMHESCVEALKRAADLAARNNVEILLENIDPEENPHYFLTSVAEGFEIVKEVANPHVKFLYDFYHEQIAEGNLIAKLEKNIGLVGLVHVADVPGRHEPGTGEIYYPNIFRKLGELGYSRYVAMEFVPQAEPVAALRAAREMAAQYGRAIPKQSTHRIDSRRFHATA